MLKTEKNEENSYFLAFPFSIFRENGSDLLIPKAKEFFEELTDYFNDNNIFYYLSQEQKVCRENYYTEEELTKFDYETMKKCEYVFFTPENPYSDDSYIELGWASALKKKIILLLEKNTYYPPLVTEITCMTNVKVYYYEDFYNDVLPIIKNYVEECKTKKDIKIIEKFLLNRKEKLISLKKLKGGNHNRTYAINNKYFVKFKDELSVKEEKMYFGKNNKPYSPKLYSSNIKEKYLIYELLDAKDFDNEELIPDLLEKAFSYSKKLIKTKKKGYGYYGIENNSWIDFLNQEVDVSKDYLKNYLDELDFKIVDKSLNEIKEYSFTKKILHGDFGLHNVMISSDRDIYFIDPEPVLGDWIYDYIFFCFSDVLTIRKITFDEIVNKINEDKNKVKAMMVIVLFNRLRRMLKYSSEDYEEYLKLWKELEDYYND